MKVRQKYKRIPEEAKNYWPLLVGIILSWSLLAVVIFKVDPEMIRDVLIEGAYLPMAGLLFLALFFLLSPLLLSTRRSLFWTVGILIFLYLRLWGLGSLLNGLLLVGLLTSLEVYWWQKKQTVAKVD